MKFLTLLLVPLFAHATCNYDENIDYRTMYPTIFSEVPISKQDIGICFAHAGSTIIDIYRMKNKSNGNVSALELAVLSKKNKPSSSTAIEGGNICDVISAAVQRGYGCDSKLEEKTIKFGYEIQGEVVKKVFLDFLTKKKNFEPISLTQYRDQKNLSNNQAETIKRMSKAYEVILGKFQKYGLDESVVSEEEIFSISQRIYLTNKFGTFGAEFSKFLFPKICTGKERLKVPSIGCETVTGNTTSLITTIDQAIDSRRPVGISYCSRVLTEKKFIATPSNIADPKICLPHASVLIGRKYDKASDKCLYLIRNSWGEKANYAWPTSRGDIWIEEDALKKNIFSVSKIN